MKSFHYNHFCLVYTAEVAIYVQAHTDNGPIFSPPWSPAHPIIRAEVAEEQDPGILFLTLQVITNFPLLQKFSIEKPQFSRLTIL